MVIQRRRQSISWTLLGALGPLVVVLRCSGGTVFPSVTTHDGRPAVVQIRALTESRVLPSVTGPAPGHPNLRQGCRPARALDGGSRCLGRFVHPRGRAPSVD